MIIPVFWPVQQIKTKVKMSFFLFLPAEKCGELRKLLFLPLVFFPPWFAWHVIRTQASVHKQLWKNACIYFADSLTLHMHFKATDRLLCGMPQIRRDNTMGRLLFSMRLLFAQIWLLGRYPLKETAYKESEARRGVAHFSSVAVPSPCRLHDQLPALIKLQNYTARGLIVQVIVLRDLWIRRPFGNMRVETYFIFHQGETIIEILSSRPSPQLYYSHIVLSKHTEPYTA